MAIEIEVKRFQNPTQIYYPGNKPFHIIQAQQFSKEWILNELFPVTDKMEGVVKKRKHQRIIDKRLEGVIGLHAFYESSTRTRLSFQQAITMLGGTFSSTENAKVTSSAIKGESLPDSTRIEDGLAFHYIVLRHDKAGGAHLAAQYSEIPIINAGDGDGQHPTQALLDIRTIQKEMGHIGGQRVAIVGDLHFGRTTHSLTYLLAKFPGITFDFISPPKLSMKKEILGHLDEHGFVEGKDYNIWDRLGDEVLKNADIVYVTRAQKERFHKRKGLLAYPLSKLDTMVAKIDNKINGIEDKNYRVDLEVLDKMQTHAIVMHPLPRKNELPPEVDPDPRVAIFRQAKNGLYTRMALLDLILNGKAA